MSPAELYARNQHLLRLPPLGAEVTLQGATYITKGMRLHGMRCILLERKSDGAPRACEPSDLADAAIAASIDSIPTKS